MYPVAAAKADRAAEKISREKITEKPLTRRGGGKAPLEDVLFGHKSGYWSDEIMTLHLAGFGKTA